MSLQWFAFWIVAYLLFGSWFFVRVESVITQREPPRVVHNASKAVCYNAVTLLCMVLFFVSWGGVVFELVCPIVKLCLRHLVVL